MWNVRCPPRPTPSSQTSYHFSCQSSSTCISEYGTPSLFSILFISDKLNHKMFPPLQVSERLGRMESSMQMFVSKAYVDTQASVVREKGENMNNTVYQTIRYCIKVPLSSLFNQGNITYLIENSWYKVHNINLIISRSG